MQAAGGSKTELQKLLILEFDEVKAEEKLEYDKAHLTLVGPVKQIQVVQVRSVFDSYKQIVFADFDCAITKAILSEIITEIHHAGFNIIGICSDLGTPNQKLHKELNATLARPYFEHPVTGANVYVMADSPHMLKLLRNHFIDNGFKLANGHIANKNEIAELIKLVNPADTLKQLSSQFHLNSSLIFVDSTARQNVRKAAMLLSNKTATGLERYIKTEEAVKTASFIHTVRY